jgi:hypothetical protein
LAVTIAVMFPRDGVYREVIVGLNRLAAEREWVLLFNELVFHRS